MGLVGVAAVALAGCSSPATSSSSQPASSESSTASSEAASSSAASSSTAASSASEESHWAYGENKDEMRGTSTKWASTDSEESFEDTFGMSSRHTELELQRRSKGVEVDISNHNLQFTCNTFIGTHVNVKFDDGPVTRYGCTNAVGDTYGVAFIIPGAKFIANAKKAKKVIIEAEVFQKGEVQQTFEVSGLKF
jgi:hypothetical protein